MKIGRDNPICLGLRSLGISSRGAKYIADQTFILISEALARGEEVDLPLGVFKNVKQTVAPYRRWRFGQPHTAYARQNRINFIPKEDLLNNG
jgi:nucleoid DNA-binding protein